MAHGETRNGESSSEMLKSDKGEMTQGDKTDMATDDAQDKKAEDLSKGAYDFENNYKKDSNLKKELITKHMNAGII